MPPTATQNVDVAHDTSASVLPALLGFGLVAAAHPPAVKVSINVRECVVVPIVSLPTATHCVAETQVTPERELLPDPRSGLATTVQDAPFQRSISVRFVGSSPRDPTAMHVVAEGQLTALSTLTPVPEFGLLTTLQLLRSRISIKVLRAVSDSYVPTATHIVVTLQVTPSR